MTSQEVLFHFTFADVNAMNPLLNYLSNTNGQGTFQLFPNGIKFAQGGSGDLCKYFNTIEFPVNGFRQPNHYIVNIPPGNKSIDVGFDFTDIHTRIKSIPKNAQSSIGFTTLKGSSNMILTKNFITKGDANPAPANEIVSIGNYEMSNQRPLEPERGWESPNIVLSTAAFCIACKDFVSLKKLSKISFRLFENHLHIVGSNNKEGQECEEKLTPFGPDTPTGEPLVTVTVNQMLLKTFDKFKAIGSEILFFASEGRPIKMVIPVGGSRETAFGWLSVYLSSA